MAYKHYSDDDKAVALAYLRAAGYPDRDGALTDAARHTGISGQQLRRWFRGENSPPNDNIVTQKEFELHTALSAELEHILDAMGNVREDASYKDLATALGIITDKVRLLEGKPTAINEDRISDARERLARGLDSRAAARGQDGPANRPN